MPVDYIPWAFTPQEQQKFQQWIDRINMVHTGTNHARNDKINWTPLGKPLSQCVVGLFTTGGVHRKSDRPFNVADPHGDWTFRVVPSGTATSDLTITHTHYNHVDADRDVNCMFPIDRLRELAEQGVIGGIGPNAYSIMGFNPDPARLMEETAPEVAQRYRTDGIDLLFMTCG